MRLARITLAIAQLYALTFGVACEDDAKPSAPSTGGGKGGRGGVVTPPRDSGTKPPPDDEDGGGRGGTGGGGGDPLKVECKDFDAAPFAEAPGDDYANSIGTPMDFAVTRAVGTWDRGCNPAKVKIILSDGECPDGDGHELTFYVDVEAVLEGENMILPEPDGTVVRVRYVRPGNLEPAGTWGSCSGAIGTFNIKGPLDPNDPENIQAMFQLELTKCDGSSATGTQMVTGRLNVDFHRTLKDVCP